MNFINDKLILTHHLFTNETMELFIMINKVNIYNRFDHILKNILFSFAAEFKYKQ